MSSNKLYVFNTTIVPLSKNLNTAIVAFRRVTIQEAREIIRKHEGKLISAVGHKATATLLQKLLHEDITFNRLNASLERGDKVIAFKPLKRLDEGVVIETEEELDEIGYEFWYYEVR